MSSLFEKTMVMTFWHFIIRKNISSAEGFFSWANSQNTNTPTEQNLQTRKTVNLQTNYTDEHFDAAAATQEHQHSNI